MALKKGVLDRYIQERALSAVNASASNRVFDKPESLKNSPPSLFVDDKDLIVSKPLAKNNESISLANQEQPASKPLASTSSSNALNEKIEIETVSNQIEALEEFQINTVHHVSKPLAIQEKFQPLVDREQTVSNPIGDREHIVTQVLAQHEQTVSKELAEQSISVSNTLDKTLVIREQSVSNNNRKIKLEELVGKEREFLNIVFNNCQFMGALETTVLTSDELINTLKITATHLRNIIFRLSKKGFVEITEYKNGRASWRKFKLTQDLFHQFKINESLTKALANREHTVSTPSPNTLATSPISSNSINNIITTVTNRLPPEWQEVNFLALSDIGFNEKHLFDIYKTNASTPEIVQESINHFAYGIEYNSEKYKTYPDLLNVLVGRLRKGHHWQEANYVSPQELAQRKLLEAKKLERERISKLQEEAYELAFSDWKEKLSAEEIENIASEKGTVGPQEVRLRISFKENVWPQVKSEYLIN